MAQATSNLTMVMTRSILKAGALAVAILLQTAQSQAATNAHQSFSATKITTAGQAGEQLTDSQWASALQAQGFFDITTRAPGTLATTASLTYDDRNLYIAFHADQANLPIRATQTTNNVGFGADDFVGVCIDTSGNGTRVFFFETTPLGTRYQQASASSRFNPLWKATAHIEKGRWTATMVIPFAAIGGSANGHDWRFNFVRNVAAVNEHYTWAYDPLMFDNQPPNWPATYEARFWPSLKGLNVAQNTARPKPQAAVYSLESVGRDRTQFPLANGDFGTQSVRVAGVDAVYPFTSSLRFVGTLDPDFSNVEVDQQTIAPQQFQRSLAEYRPFFARGAQYFNPNVFPGVIVPNTLIFYTPAIGPFDSGVKVEGTSGLNAFGVLNVKGAGFNDTAYGYKYRRADGSVQVWSDGAMTRDALGRDAAAEIGSEIRNVHSGLIFGVDQGGEWNPLIPDASLARNTMAFVDSQKPNFETYLGYRNAGPYFAPRTSFTALTDFRGPEAYLNFLGPGAASGPIKSEGIFFSADRFRDRSGAVRQADLIGNLDVVFKTLLHVSLSQQTSESRFYNIGYPTYAGAFDQRFDQSSVFLGFREQSASPSTVSFSAGPFGNAYVQEYGANTTRQLGTSTSVLLGFGATYERNFSGGADGQYLRRLSWSRSLGPDSSLTIALRSISGTGGFAQPGVNLAAIFHRRVADKNDLYTSFGTPAATATLNRFIVKYVWQLGTID
ncbi:MAG: hypothetical protein DLM53_06420 [Candidatus Eremiobacter antarcticus]|nr:hypothetical protein [Candidatus Eremiobacteraeota bacterium]PZR62447.1 MAG: hypothetical protein DLM53_06420 [Candidatus Eremiobacter sp. RRmetagenome_bin22]